MIELFGKAGKVIVEMQNENLELEKKFGTNARFVQNRMRQTNILAEFFDMVVEKMNDDQKALFIQTANYNAMKILFEQEAGTSYAEMAEDLSFDKKDWKLLDELDSKIEKWDNEING